MGVDMHMGVGAWALLWALILCGVHMHTTHMGAAWATSISHDQSSLISYAYDSDSD